MRARLLANWITGFKPLTYFLLFLASCYSLCPFPYETYYIGRWQRQDKLTPLVGSPRGEGIVRLSFYTCNPPLNLTSHSYRAADDQLFFGKIKFET